MLIELIYLLNIHQQHEVGTDYRHQEKEVLIVADFR
jgi:hypothetical protein